MTISISCFARGAALLAALAAGTFPTNAARAEATVTISEMHLCCRGCTIAVEKAVAKVEGVKCVTSQDDGTTVLTAADLPTLQKALNRMAHAGFCGKLDSKELKFQELKLPDGNVQRLEIAHVHNCCGACTDAIKVALAEVEGVTSDTCKSKQVKFVIEGDFSAKDAVAALLKAGFYPRLPKPAT